MISRPIPRLHLVGPLDVVSPERYVEIAARAAVGGVDAVHVRLPGLPGGEVLALARRLNSALSARLIVNDRVDVAKLSAAFAVQLGERSLTVDDARALLGPDALIGRSVHDVAGAIAAERAGASYLIAGNVFATDSKRGQPGRGLDWLAELCGAVDIPVIAIGGVRSARIADVIGAGAYGAAVGRDVLLADDPRAAAADLRSDLERILTCNHSGSTR